MCCQYRHQASSGLRTSATCWVRPPFRVLCAWAPPSHSSSFRYSSSFPGDQQCPDPDFPFMKPSPQIFFTISFGTQSASHFHGSTSLALCFACPFVAPVQIFSIPLNGPPHVQQVPRSPLSPYQHATGSAVWASNRARDTFITPMCHVHPHLNHGCFLLSEGDWIRCSVSVSLAMDKHYTSPLGCDLRTAADEVCVAPEKHPGTG